jgi:hypothetical protein
MCIVVDSSAAIVYYGGQIWKYYLLVKSVAQLLDRMGKSALTIDISHE